MAGTRPNAMRALRFAFEPAGSRAPNQANGSATKNKSALEASAAVRQS